MKRGYVFILFFVAASRAVTLSKRAAGGCETQADVTFVLDSSDVVGRDNFQKELEFVKNTVNNIDTGPNKTRISVVTFSSGVYNQFFLNQFASKSDIVNAISNIPYYGGLTHTADAIRYVTQTSFNPVHGARSDVPHIAVLVTNGPSTTKDITKVEAQTAKDNNILMYGVGVGSGVDSDELQSVTSDPDSRYLLHAEHYGSLNDLSGVLSTRLCNELPSSGASLPPPNSCLQNADVVFLIDSSTSVGPSNYQKMENFLKNAISKLDMGPSKVHVGLMQYSSYPSVEFPLNMYSNRGETMKAVENLKYMSGGTNTADAIKYMDSVMFSQNSGARPNVPRIGIVITDGGSINGAATTAAADQARQHGIGLVAVGVGGAAGRSELNNIANSPAADHVVSVNSYSDLDGAVDQVLSKTCSLQATVAPQTTGPTTSSNCADKKNNCKMYGQGVCQKYKPWATENCAMFCGFCKAPKVPCNDSLSNCADYGKNSCVNFPQWAQDNCKQFCGFCAGETSSGFYGKCSYKGKSYITGAKWTDGCNYDCVCEDGNTGNYKCFNSCPLYHDLPKDCTLIQKKGECCLQPVCNFHQTVQNIESASVGQTTTGIKVCLYKTKQYFQGQTWQDGCDYQCTCINSTIGLHRCQSVCPQYNNLPSNCHLDKKPGDCCEKPICEFDQQHGSFQGTGSVSGSGVGANPTTPKPCEDRINTCAQYGKSVCTSYAGWAGDNCAKFCGICSTGVQTTPNPSDKCLFKGKAYKQGESWTNGCSTKCICENAVYGYYRCVNTCPTYNNLPAGCYEMNRAGQCCKAVRCDSGSFVASTTNPGSIGDGGMIQVLNPSGGYQYFSPTQPSTGATNAPGTGGTGFLAPTLKGCLFKGQLYVQDQSWEDGCTYACQCKNETAGAYACRPRCPMYQNLPSSCRMETDVNDPCCQAPRCRYDPLTGSTFLPVPSFQQAIMYNGLVRPPTTGELYNNKEYTGSVILVQTNLTPAPPTQKANVTGGVGYCLYRGTRYTQGETWKDGCQYNCVCEDSSTGLYRCVEMCNHFGDLPAQYCFLKTDPTNPCCKIPECHFGVHYITNTGYLSTAKPATDYCEYKGTHYQQGQSWFDGCSYKCTCDDALGGIYTCLERCPHYQNVNPNCTFVVDPSDPICCQVPHCPIQGSGNGSANALVTPAPLGVHTGFEGEGGKLGKCVYKGSSYTQGEQWSDGCEFDCQCTDANRGHYTCQEKCSKYPNLPPQCRLVSDFTNPCCKKPKCDFNGTIHTVTNAPLPGQPTRAPNPIPTLAPKSQYCVYNGANYIQGQTWDDSCLYRCRCEDASRGVYICNERCPKYDNLPKECGLVADYRDPCCLVPRCIIPPLTGNASGSILTPDMIPTPAPGVIVGHMNIPTPAPRPGVTYAPPVLTWCEYKGQRHQQGQKWYDGCDYDCTCTNAATGTYKCVERCPRYMNVPAQCRLVKDPSNPCCTMPQCDPVAVTPSIYDPTTPTWPSVTPPGGGIPTASPKPIDVCMYKGVPYTQGQQWFDGCDYKCYCENGPAGVYRCNQRCSAYTNLPANCNLVPDPQDALCCEVPQCNFSPTNNITSGFGLIPTAPVGTFTGGSVVNPTPRPNLGPTLTPRPGGTGPTAVPSLQPTARPSLSPPGGTQIPTFKDVCVYKGQQYTQGQRWQDGCDYNCQCMNAQSGFYQCSERCPRYVNLPSQCQLVRDYLNPCCMKPYCTFSPTPAPSPGVSTLTPGLTPTPGPDTDVCVYSGVPYKQGQTWSDGCDLNCVCENATTGYFRCDDRCPHYATVPSQCRMVTDPRDSCCKRPLCEPVIQPTRAPGQVPTPGVGLTYPPWLLVTPTPGPNLTYAPDKMPKPTYPPFMVPTPGPGLTYAPGLVPTLTYPPGLIPTLTPSTSPVPVPAAVPGIFEGIGVGVTGKGKVCIYQGKAYHQGQKWQDGCSYNCECLDEQSGRYRCVERCPVYLSVPSYCRLVVDSKDSCCKTPECNPPPVDVPTAQPSPGGPTLGPHIPGVTPGLPPTKIPGQPYTGPTLTPGLNPSATPTNAPVPSHSGPTQSPPLKEMCVYNGVPYTQGQQWYVGCDKKCICEDGKSGYYRCSDRCAKYPSIPASCTLAADPNDPQCCQVPQCIPIPQIGQTPSPTGGTVIYTNVPGIITGIGMRPTPRPGLSPTLAPGQIPTLAPGETLPPGQTLPTYVPSLQSTRAPLPNDVCIYKGQSYHQGQKWLDGCKYNCECKNAKTGLYQCQERCPTFPVVPPWCQMKRDPSDYCCYKPVCNPDQKIPTPGPVVTPTGGASIPGMTPVGGTTASPPPGGSGTTNKPGLTPQIGPTNAPNPSPVGPGGNTPILAFCVFNGVPFQQGQTWDQGCSQKCRCDNAVTNYYSCYDRCPSFNNLDAGCKLVTDPQDPCCQIPECPIPTPGPNGKTPTLSPNPGPTLKPGQTPVPHPSLGPGMTPGPNAIPNPSPYPVPTLAPGKITGHGPQSPQGVPQMIGFCEYKGQKYGQGQKWDDGCSYKCECIAVATGSYTCTERCPRFVKIPSYCTMVTDSKDSCCRVPYCSPTQSPDLTPSPAPGVSPGQQPSLVPGLQPSPSPTPPKEVCVYNGKQYFQDQKWYDGCNKMCVCENAKTGYSACSDRCPTFSGLDPHCIMVPDQSDPACCKVPQCSTVNLTNPVGVHGTFNGVGLVPTPRPSFTPTPVPGASPNPNQQPTASPSLRPTPKVCYYKGNQYLQGQKWQDGCSYKCECKDANRGMYACRDRCARYPNLPVSCRMEYDPLDPCCERPNCVPTAATTLSPGQPGPGGSTAVPGINPSAGPTAHPGLNPTKATLIPTLDFCVYKGIPFKQGQTWNDGCDKVCRCDDATSGVINCDERCPTYPALKPGCKLVTDPRDQCCRLPQCQTNSTIPTQIIIGYPGTITNGGYGPVANPGSPFTGTRNGCVYKGKYYTQNQQWEDGCNYDCECINANSGQYRCTEKCARYANLPSYCTMIQDPNKPCCEKPYCTPVVVPTPSPNGPGFTPTPGQATPPQFVTLVPGGPTIRVTPGTGPTAVPPLGSTLTPPPVAVTPLLPPQIRPLCVYKGQYYQQGQLWYDECDKVCRCEEASTRFYRCQERCAKYSNISSGCTMVPDPRDPSCCKIPDCPFVPPASPPTPGIYTPQPTQPAIITGIGKVPTPAPQPTPSLAPGQTTKVPPINVTPQPGCLYKGILHQPGERWDDGCDFICECSNGMTGQYKCFQRCQRYPGLPSNRCVLVQDPNDKCCEVPFCDYLNPTPFPNGRPTPRPPLSPSSGTGATPGLQPGVSPTRGPGSPNPSVNPFLVPIIYPTRVPNLVPSPNGKIPGLIPQQQGFCVYKGVYYTQGQTWQDGCNLLCRCEQPTKGYYQCTKRCHSYNNLPNTCHLKTDPSDACCLVPDCNRYPTPAPPVTPPIGQTLPPTTPIPIVVPTPITGTFTGTGGNPSGFTGGGINYCIYKGKVYSKGMTWDDGCNYRCECVDPSRGLYQCNDRCPQYYYLPTQCHYEQDPKDSCCRIAKCDMNLPTPAPPIGPTPYPTIRPPGPTTPTIGPTVHWTGPTLKPTEMCLYTVNNNTYSKGQTWKDGCDYVCKCDDPSQNKYTCTARCQAYSSLPDVCQLVPDPKDSCCEIPSCGSYSPSFNSTGTPPPHTLNVLPIGTHTFFTGSSWGPGSNYPITGKRDVCIYKNHVYQQSESWDDGCRYVCTCSDAERGLYRCFTKCPQYPPLPAYCHAVTIPGQCCPSVTCDVPGLGMYTPSSGLVPTPAPTRKPGAPTTLKPTGLVPVLQIIPAGSYGNITGGIGRLPGGGYPIKPSEISAIRDQCIYKNKVYNQGETWEISCDYTCTCLDGGSGYFECNPLCATYPQLPVGCYLLQNPGDCCQKPQCTASWGSFNPLGHPELGFTVYGQYTGGFTGFRPGTNFTQYLPGYATSGTRDVCIYKGVVYHQGEKWDDGCDYQCSCEDAQVGRYQCIPKCPAYVSLPFNCLLVDVPNDCCKKVNCTDPKLTTLAPSTVTPPPPTTTPNPDPNCRDKIDNCAEYGQSACKHPYEVWAKRNCRSYCNIECYGIGVSTPKPLCEDKLKNCDEYGKDSCVGKYTQWATENCASYCNLCIGHTTIPPTTTTSKPCNDLTDCSSFGTSICSDDTYKDWVVENCAKYCNKCPGSGGGNQPGGSAIPVTGGQGWLLLMKGVAGIPGDLYQLWSGNGVMNPNAPGANYLTSQFHGHYKPDLSNNWNAICIDKVKVSIYNKGVEKAYIIFNATNTDKMGWFTADRIIDSSWIDLNSATKQYFSMKADPNFAREFYAAGINNGCDSTGWMMVSTTTTNPCQFEQDSKPAFYYAPGQTQSKFGFTKPGSGDVFAIQGHSTCPPPASTSSTGQSKGCVYKGKIYTQGQRWVDDCTYNCTCDDENTGHFTCIDLCPVYQGLPPSVQLVKVQGQCCPRPELNVTGTIHYFTNAPRFCIYKGNTYGQDEIWYDGCKYKCQCIDVQSGNYRCADRCVTWNLPPVCSFNDPKQGKCCRTPVCPPYVEIVYPPGYKEE